MRFKYINYFKYFFLLLGCIGCKKLVRISEPIDTTTTTETFSTDGSANSAVTGIYSDMSFFNGSGIAYANGATTLYTGLSSDELRDNTGGYLQYQDNLLLADDNISSGVFWNPMYYHIYMTNAAIEGISASSTMSQSAKTELTGEAKFVRAFCYFYLVNLYGDVPLALSTAWAKTSNLPRSPAADVYKQIETDLVDAKGLLPADYSLSNGERIRPNKWAAAALLSRVYLYTNQWKNAEDMASSVINNGSGISLVTSLDSTFLKNNTEAIWQLEVVQYPFATQEAYFFIPYDNTSSPNFYLTDQLLNAFEPNDARRISWVDSSDVSGMFYYYPYKYKTAQGTAGSLSEHYTMLRLGEQYLIRAEARAKQQNWTGAIGDINIIRTRAGLMELPSNLTPEQVFAGVVQERRIELFAEWGHRWFDLKRTGQVDAVLGPIKASWKPTAALFPIPPSELKVDHNLTQNDGY